MKYFNYDPLQEAPFESGEVIKENFKVLYSNFPLILILCFFVNTIAYSQTQTLKLKYTQTVLKDGKEIEEVHKGGFLNVFNPSLTYYGERNKNLEFEVHIIQDTIFVQSVSSITKKVFSTKYQIKGDTYYLNLLTGEKELFDYEKRLSHSKNLHDKLKLKKKKPILNIDCEIQFYKAKKGQKEIQLSVCKNKSIENRRGVFNDYFFDGQLVVERRFFVKETKKEVILNLVSIDTISNSTSIKEALYSNQELVISNNNLLMDSIGFGLEAPNIFYRDVGNEEIVSLNKFKGNGKFLVIDFWGTWCKPCLASIPELKDFYEKYSENIDLLSMNYKDSGLAQIKEKIKETGMDWPQGIATEKINKILNPMSFFPGVLMFDDEMKLVLRDKAKAGLKKIENIIEKENEIQQNH